MPRLFVAIDEPSDEPVQYVGVYVLRWGKVSEPTIGFREATDEEIAEAVATVAVPIVGTLDDRTK